MKTSVPFLRAVRLVLIAFAASFVVRDDLTAQVVDFQRDVQPILAESCLQCHGIDEAARQGGLRLDTRDTALKGGDSNAPAIVPGKSDPSELIRRVTSTDPAEVMPPSKGHKPLTPPQIQILKK